MQYHSVGNGMIAGPSVGPYRDEASLVDAKNANLTEQDKAGLRALRRVLEVKYNIARPTLT